MSHTSIYIDGRWQSGGGASFTSLNPCNGEMVWQGNAASAEQIEQAIQSARKIQPYWGSLPLDKRVEFLQRFVELLGENKQALAECIARETGKPHWEALTEVGAMVGKVNISIKAYHERTGTVENDAPGAKAFIRHKPHGVVAVFGPYNFPGHLPNGHIVPALLAGNTVVFKPSELTPAVAEMTLQLWHQVGLPRGVINLVQGEIETGKSLANNPNIDGLFFTGSSQTGQLLHKQFAGRPEKILALEMGGNNPLLVHNVKDKKAAVHDMIQSAFITSGQRCTCARRIFIEKSQQGDEILDAFVAAAKAINVDDSFAEPQPFMGAVISQQAANILLQAQDDLLTRGGKALLEMRHLKANSGLLTPAIIDMTQAESDPDEEYFGPLVKVYRYEHFEDAIEQANQTAFGLSAGLLADNKSDYDYFYTHIRAGIVNWNRPITGASSAAPFGGVGASGNHRASAYYAADYCAYPVASLEADHVSLPETLAPGLSL